jgi:hypothetical protein
MPARATQQDTISKHSNNNNFKIKYYCNSFGETNPAESCFSSSTILLVFHEGQRRIILHPVIKLENMLLSSSEGKQ